MAGSGACGRSQFGRNFFGAAPMIKRYGHVLGLYFRNRTFLILTLCYGAAAVISRIAMRMDIDDVAYDFFTMWFIVCIWISFIFGIQLKRQFANHRASLMPRYRSTHLLAGGILYAFFTIIAVLWWTNLKIVLANQFIDLPRILLTCIFVSLLIVTLGYLSISVFLFMAYFSILLLASQSYDIVMTINTSSSVLQGVWIGIGGLIFFLILRLWYLKEDGFEYPFLLTWPQKDLMRNQLQAAHALFAPLRRFIFIRRVPLTIPKYPFQATVIRRVMHWDIFDHAELKWVWVLLVLVSPFYIHFVRTAVELHEFYAKTYANFLLLAVSPVLIAVIANYKKMAYWGYDLLKPVPRERVIRERGMGIFGGLIVLWVLFCFYFSVIPSMVLDPSILKTIKFWAYILLTGSYAFASLSWLALMSQLNSAKAVIVHGLISIQLSLLLFYAVEYFSPMTVVFCGVLVLMGGVVLLQCAYARWCKAEFW
jgi:hypothetical protein